MKPNLCPARVALYARVSSDHQAEEGTIASQVEAIQQRLQADGLTVDAELYFLDDGYSGSTLLRPQLERLRDQAAAGALDRLYVLAPDRLARNFPLQYLLLEELQANGVTVLFLNRPLGQSPEDDLLLQVQGVIAEYERAKIMERARRGKQYAARQGRVSVLSQAPYGYRYVRKAEGGGEARFDILLEEARVVRQLFSWVGQERLSLRDVCQRLERQGVPTRTGKRRWSSAAVAALLNNTAYLGEARYGKTRVVARRPQLRPRRHQPEVPRRPYSIDRTQTQPLPIAVPALVSPELFAQVAEQLAENRRRARARRSGSSCLLQGLIVCRQCGYACCGIGRSGAGLADGPRYRYYRCSGRGHQGDDGRRLCQVRPLPAAALEAAVWSDVSALLAEPARVQQEYERRLQDAPADATGAECPALAKRLASVQKAISRLIDGYSEGLLEKEEFEPRLRSARERLARLQAEAHTQADAAARRAELRLVIGKLQEFAAGIQSGLQEADWAIRREVIRALVKQIEVGDTEIRIVYRVPPVPFVERPEGGVLQDCPRRRGSIDVAWPIESRSLLSLARFLIVTIGRTFLREGASTLRCDARSVCAANTK